LPLIVSGAPASYGILSLISLQYFWCASVKLSKKKV